MDHRRPGNMRTTAILFVLVCSLLSPMVSATVQPSSENEINLTNEGNVIATFSPIIQAALAHKSDLSMYSTSQLNSVKQWVVIASHFDGQPAEELPGAWIVDVEQSTGPELFSKLQESGQIEAF